MSDRKRYHVEFFAVVAIEVYAEDAEQAITEARGKVEAAQEDIAGCHDGLWVQPIDDVDSSDIPFAEEVS